MRSMTSPTEPQFHSVWPSESGRTMTQALALGLGSMFNHSLREQNVGWTRNLQYDCIVYTALKFIPKGEELCISYGSARLWFEDADRDPFESYLPEDLRADSGETLGELELSGLSGMQL